MLIPPTLLYLMVISDNTSPLVLWPPELDFIRIPSGILVVFVSVVFVNSPTMFCMVHGLALNIKTWDYVAAAQTRGEGT